MLYKYVSLSLLSLLTGCSSIQYVEPIEGPRTKVRFVATAPTPYLSTTIRGYSDSSCSKGETEWMRLLNENLINSSPKSLGLPLANYHKDAYKELYFPTNIATHGMFFGHQTIGGTQYKCGVPFSYKFSENENYEVKLNWHVRECTASISKFVNESGTWKLEEMAKFTNKVNEHNKDCLTQFEKTRWY